MSKRYGRKQKARARTEIAHLKERLNRESTSHLYSPGDEPELTVLSNVLDYRVTEDSDRGMINRTAYVTILAPCDWLLEMSESGGLVQFQGTRYCVVSAAIEPAVYFGGEQTIEIELAGVS